MDTPITRAEHEEFCKRMEGEDKRQNRRIEELEENVRQIGTLTASVEKLAYSIEGMVKEQERQGKRLEALESRDGEMWRKVTSHLLTVVIGIIVGYIFTQVGIGG